MNKLRKHKARRLPEILLLSLTFLLQTLFLQLETPDTVLCIEENGKIVVEKEGQDSECTHIFFEDINSQYVKNDYHAHKCVDIPLDKNPEKNLQIRVNSELNPALHVPLFQTTGHVDTAIQKPLKRIINILPIHSKILEGVSLLI